MAPQTVRRASATRLAHTTAKDLRTGGRFLHRHAGAFSQTPAMQKLTNAQISQLKGQAQRMKATFKVGREGLSPAFLAAVDEALNYRELLKVKFDEFKEQKKELAPKLAEGTRSQLITRVGNVAVLYRPKPPAPDATPAAGGEAGGDAGRGGGGSPADTRK